MNGFKNLQQAFTKDYSPSIVDGIGSRNSQIGASVRHIALGEDRVTPDRQSDSLMDIFRSPVKHTCIFNMNIIGNISHLP